MRRNDRAVTDIGGIEEILARCKICHVAMTDDGSPYVVPLSYGYRIVNGGILELFFHSAPEGRKLDVLKGNSRVCFEMAYEGESVSAETPCNSGYYFSSVIGFGEALFIEDSAEKGEALTLLFRHQTDKNHVFTAEQSKGVCVFKIVSKEFTGKKKPHPGIAVL